MQNFAAHSHHCWMEEKDLPIWVGIVLGIVEIGDLVTTLEVFVRVMELYSLYAEQVKCEYRGFKGPLQMMYEAL